jgi:hypothetical protein
MQGNGNYDVWHQNEQSPDGVEISPKHHGGRLLPMQRGAPFRTRHRETAGPKLSLPVSPFDPYHENCLKRGNNPIFCWDCGSTATQHECESSLISQGLVMLA